MTAFYQQQRVSRRHHSKTRTGCVTCKNRHVKCDETRPNCVRCSSTGRKCEGYGDELPVVLKTRRSVDPALSSLFGTPEEFRSFQYFQEKTLPMIAEISLPQFWNEIVLQLCHSEPVIKHSVIAIALVHQAPTLSSAELATQRLNRLYHHHKALKQLTSTSSSDVLLIVIASELFAAYEYFSGKDIQAQQHILAGAKIIQDYKAKDQRHRNSVTDQTIETYLDPLYELLLAQQAALQAGTPPVIPTIVESPLDVTDWGDELMKLPNRFQTFDQAKQLFNELIEHYIWDFVDPLRQHDEHRVLKPLTDSLHHIVLLIDDFIDHNDVVVQTLSNTVDLCPLIRAHHFSTIIMTRLLPYDDETLMDQHMVWDCLLYKIKPVVEPYINLEPSDQFIIQETIFGFIPPLFLCASRCRDPRVRRQALHLLYKLKRHEGGWNSAIAAKIAETIMKIEERDATKFVQGPDDIPKEQRIRALSVHIDRKTNRAILSYVEWPYLVDGKVLEETVSNWTLREGKQWNERIAYPLTKILRLVGFQGLVSGVPMEPVNR